MFLLPPVQTLFSKITAFSFCLLQKNKLAIRNAKDVENYHYWIFWRRQKEKAVILLKRQFALAGGGTLNCPILTTGGYGAEIQYQGVTVLSNLGNGWGYEMTPAELAKKDEFYSIYWSEYNLVKESGSSELREMPDYLNQDRPSFEARA